MAASLPHGLRLVDVEEARYEEWLDRFLGTFGHAVRGDAELVDFFRATHPAERAIAVDSEAGYVATGSAIELHLALPGGHTVPMAGVTGLTVDPTVRRRGVLRAMMDHLHRRAVDERVPVAGLGASEWPIYERFGYGATTWFESLDIESRAAGWRDDAPGGELLPRLISEKEAKDLGQILHERQARETPGEILRPEPHWDRFTAGAASSRIDAVLGMSAAGMGSRHCVAIDDRGLATYRIRSDWAPEETPRNTILVTDLLAADPATEAALWRHVLSVDLVTAVHVPRVAVDAPLRWWVADARRLRPHRHDGLWLRPLDVVTLLQAREWSGSGTLTVAIHDREGYAEGAFRLDIDTGRCSCAQTSEEADLEMDVATLGAIVLGGTSAMSLATSGRIRSTDHRSARMWDAMATPGRAPFCSSSF